MELIRREMPQNYRLIDTGDWHIGSVNFHEDGVRKLVKQIQDSPDLFIVLKGDLIEGISPQDKRYNLRSIDDRFKTAQDQAEFCTELLKPIKEKIIGITIGNHELKCINTYDVIKHICQTLKLDNWMEIYGAGIFKFIALNNGKVAHKMLFCHGKKMLPQGAKDPIQRKANQMAAQKRILEELGHADCVYTSQGHHHRLLAVKPTVENQLYLTDDGKKIKAKYRVLHRQNADYIPAESRFFCGTGSYRKSLCEPGSGAIDYAELLQVGPAELGHIEIIIQDSEVVDAREVVV